jgi:uncharacterized protein YkwD/outer membrane murein-binding lipoprotein Lpp
MARLTESDFWKKYSIVLIVLTVVIFIIVFTSIPKIFDFFNNINNAGYSTLQQIRQSGDDILPSVLREKLTAKDVIKLTNNARAVNGLHPLAENQLLNLIAESRANDMLEKQYFAHVSPTGQQASDIAQTIGYHYKIIAENIGSGDFYTNQKIVDGWMQSPGHRANILSTEVQEIGAAVIRGKMKNADTYVTVQIFGLQSLPVAQKTCVAPSSNLLNDIEAKKAEIASLQDQLNSLKQELDNEQEAIETDKKYTYDNAEKIQKLNERINAFNEKSRWYNKIVGEVKAKSDVAQSMVNEYNRMSQIYNDCRSSHDIHD